VARSREPEFDDGFDEALDARAGRDRDGVASLRDVEAEAGDEAGLSDDYDMDDKAARELGVDLDDRDEPEPTLD
jgi:hypothetical protein